MRKHLDAAAYWQDIGPRLEVHINAQRNAQVEQCLVHAFALYSFVWEDFSKDATKNQAILRRVGVMLVHIHDVLRGLISGQAELSPVTIAALLRISLEVRCNFLFIIKSGDPDLYSGRFERYEGIERILREEYAPPGTLPLLSKSEEERIRKDCAEWFNDKGKVAIKHWTADDKYKSLKALAESVGLQDEYHKVYSIGSKFVHGSSLVRNLYSKRGNMGALANPGLCAELSLLASLNCIEMLREAADFFGVPPFEEDFLVWQDAWIECQKAIQRRAT